MRVKIKREASSKYTVNLPYKDEISVENMTRGIVTKTKPAKNVKIVVRD